jgi:Glycolipid 2-alpha-mannosyltransferase
MALLIQWVPFFDYDGGGRDYNARSQLVPLKDIFYSPCFQWDLSLTHQSIADYNTTRFVDLENGNDRDFDALVSGNISSWQQYDVVRLRCFFDFTPLVLINPNFEAVAKSFPRNSFSSAREPRIPNPSTLMMRYLFMPNVKNYDKGLTTELQRLRNEIIENCAGSKFYGLHLRLRSEYATQEKVFFPCLERLSAFTGDTCYFIASDSENTTAIVKPYLPPSARLLYLNMSRERDTTTGLLGAILELFILGSSSLVFGCESSTFISVAANIQGIPINEYHCDTRESSVASWLCNSNLLRKAVVKVINGVVDNELDQRYRLGCVLRDKYPPNGAYNVDNYTPKVMLAPHACIMYVLTSTSNIPSLLVSIKSLEQNLFGPISRTYPVIVLTQNISQDELSPLLTLKSSMDLTVSDLGPWILPPSLVISDAQKSKDEMSLAQCHLNRFLSGPIFKHAMLEGFEYVMRIGTASSLCRPVNGDPFERIRDKGLNYGAYTAYLASELPMTGLDDAIKSFLRNNGIRPINIHKTLDPSGHLMPHRFPDNYEIMRIEFFQHGRYYDYFEALDKELGFFNHGWDQGVIRHTGLRLFTPPALIKDFSDMISCEKNCKS